MSPQWTLGLCADVRASGFTVTHCSTITLKYYLKTLPLLLNIIATTCVSNFLPFIFAV